MPASEPPNRANRLLAGLPRADRRVFIAACRPVALELAEVLAESGKPIREVYFPGASFISQSTQANGCASLEVGLIGAEGMLGISLALGVGVSPLHAVVQGSGTALAINATEFRVQLAAMPALARLLDRYLSALMAQLAQTAVCTRFHVVQARVARLLLMTQDRAHAPGFQLTHELLAGRLGVRRAGVTNAATALQRRGLIRYRRGNITILDRGGLEAAACDCYAADNVVYRKMMGEQRGRSR